MYPITAIVHPAKQTELLGQLVHKWPEAHALHNAGDMDMICMLLFQLCCYGSVLFLGHFLLQPLAPSINTFTIET